MGIGGVSVGLGAELAQKPQHSDATPEAKPQPGTKGFFFVFVQSSRLFKAPILFQDGGFLLYGGNDYSLLLIEIKVEFAA